MSFEQYVSEINSLARCCGAISDGKENYCNPEAWRDAYQHGRPPQKLGKRRRTPLHTKTPNHNQGIKHHER